jgi:hypothetical protein
MVAAWAKSEAAIPARRPGDHLTQAAAAIAIGAMCPPSTSKVAKRHTIALVIAQALLFKTGADAGFQQHVVHRLGRAPGR